MVSCWEDGPLIVEGVVGDATGEDRDVEGAMAKWLAPKQAAEAIQSCLLFHGWSGYGNDLPFA